jgi:hypothetical protein
MLQLQVALGDPQSRPDGLFRSRQVNHWKVNRRTISDSSLLRQGRGRGQFGLETAFCKFLIELSRDGIGSPSCVFTGVATTTVVGSKGLSVLRKDRWQIFRPIFRITGQALPLW